MREDEEERPAKPARASRERPSFFAAPVHITWSSVAWEGPGFWKRNAFQAVKTAARQELPACWPTRGPGGAGQWPATSGSGTPTLQASTGTLSETMSSEAGLPWSARQCRAQPPPSWARASAESCLSCLGGASRVSVPGPGITTGSPLAEAPGLYTNVCQAVRVAARHLQSSCWLKLCSI